MEFEFIVGVVQALHFMNEIRYRSYDLHEPVYTQAEINNRTNVDPTLDTNFRLSADSRNDNNVLRWYNTNFQRCINTGVQHIFNAGCQNF